MTVRTSFEPGEFCWIDLNAHDLEAAAAWYGELFGWTLERQDTHGGPPYAFFTKDGAVVAGIGQMSDEMKAQGVPPLWNSYVCTADCEASEAAAREAGGQVIVPTMEVPGHGKLAYFTDPEGAVIAVWQSTGGETRFRTGEHGSLSWNELMTRDLDAAGRFYGALFGWELVDAGMPGVAYHLLRQGGRDLGGAMAMEGEQFAQVPPHWAVYFDVDDCTAAAGRAKESGGSVLVPPTEIPVGWFSVVHDPQGGTFGLMQLRERSGG